MFVRNSEQGKRCFGTVPEDEKGECWGLKKQPQPMGRWEKVKPTVMTMKTKLGHGLPKAAVISLCDPGHLTCFIIHVAEKDFCDMASKYIRQITALDLSNGSLTDKGGKLLLEKLPELPNIEILDVHHHYLSNEMMEELQKLSITVNLAEQEKPYEWNGDRASLSLHLRLSSTSSMSRG